MNTRLVILFLIGMPGVHAQSGMPLLLGDFNTTVEIETTIIVNEGGDADIETLMNISASEEFNKALREQLLEFTDKEEKRRVAEQLKAALTLMGYDVKRVEVGLRDDAVFYRLGIRRFATRMNDTWIIKPSIEGFRVKPPPIVTFTHYFVVQEVEIRLPKGSEVLLVSPKPYEKKISGGEARLEVGISQIYSPRVRFSYYAHLPPGTNLASVEDEPLKVIYVLTPVPLSSKKILLLSALIIGASVILAYRVRRNG